MYYEFNLLIIVILGLIMILSNFILLDNTLSTLYYVLSDELFGKVWSRKIKQNGWFSIQPMATAMHPATGYATYQQVAGQRTIASVPHPPDGYSLFFGFFFASLFSFRLWSRTFLATLYLVRHLSRLDCFPAANKNGDYYYDYSRRIITPDKVLTLFRQSHR